MPKTSQNIRELKGANMDIDLIPSDKVNWKIEECPWNKAENTTKHKCAVKNTSLCPYFRGIKYPDIVLCVYPEK